jgi:chromosome segregation ATPase
MPLAGGGDVMVDMMVPDKAELEVTKAELEVTKAELEVTKAELEDSQTKMKSIGEKWGSTADAVMDLNSQIEKLNEQNQQLQANLSEIQNTIKSKSKSLRSQAKASKKAITMISSRIEDLQNELNQKVDRLQKQQGDELHMQTQWFAEELGKSDQRISEVRADISKLQADINNIKTGEWEKPNKSKRTFAILAAMAGGIAWFAVNAVGSSD